MTGSINRLRAISREAREHWPFQKEERRRHSTGFEAEVRAVLEEALRWAWHEPHCRSEGGFECSCGFGNWNERRRAVLSKMEKMG